MDKLVSSLFTSLGLRKGMRKEREKKSVLSFVGKKQGEQRAWLAQSIGKVDAIQKTERSPQMKR